MKKLLISLIALLFVVQLRAQQWSGSTTPAGTIYRNGNVGIGPDTGIPGFASLFVNNGGGLNPTIMLKNTDALANQRIWAIMAQGNRFRILTEADNYGSIQDAFIISRSGINITTSVFPYGNVGIGTLLTNNPNNYKLAVKGKIGAQEVQVENTSATWADYVFQPDYELMPLLEVESFIKSKKHLPEIPSAQEVKENGHKLGEMDVLLLKKVEELTLYVIDQEKRLQEQEVLIQLQQKLLLELKERLEASSNENSEQHEK